MSRSRQRGQKLTCSNPKCTNVFYRPRLEIKKVERSYCSHTCAARINNLRFPRRTRQLKKCDRDDCSAQIPIKRRFCSVACYTVERVYPPDKLIKEIQQMARKLKRTPAKRELPDITNACVWAFGSWNKALAAASLAPNRSHSQRMYKRTNTVALDGHRCDSISEALVDNWLTKHGIAHDRNARYPSTDHKADWRISDTIFIEYFGLANDSPRYDRSIQDKRRLCERHNIRLIEIYSEDLYPIVKLDDKFKHLEVPVRVI